MPVTSELPCHPGGITTITSLLFLTTRFPFRGATPLESPHLHPLSNQMMRINYFFVLPKRRVRSRRLLSRTYLPGRVLYSGLG